MSNFLRSKFLIILILCASSVTKGDVVPSPLFSDNALLQQGITASVWGTASENEKVTVEFYGQKVSTIAKNGRWLVRLEPMQASAEPRTLTISGNNSLTFQNILVGEVWICSGQSNMERQLGLRSGQPPLANWEQEAAGANYPQIRQFLVKPTISTTPLSEAVGAWEVCSQESAPRFTAVGYYFGRDLHKRLQVPIGLINSTWGGTPPRFVTHGPPVPVQISTTRRACLPHPSARTTGPRIQSLHLPKPPTIDQSLHRVAFYKNAILTS
jgi:sialate O-acetylesterase